MLKHALPAALVFVAILALASPVSAAPMAPSNDHCLIPDTPECIQAYEDWVNNGGLCNFIWNVAFGHDCVILGQ